MRRKTVEILTRTFSVFSVLGIGLTALCISSLPQASASTSRVEAGFPADFVDMYIERYGSFIDTGGFGEGQMIGGFGGLKNKSRAENQKALKHTPVILLHGNGVHALHDEGFQMGLPVPTLGMWPIRDFLLEENYNDAEIWAISYLGTNPPPEIAQWRANVRSNLPDVRRFIDTVIEYLGVEKVDIIAHSLGNNMAKGYMNGFQSDNSWDNRDHRLDKIGTYISLAAGHYGAPPNPWEPADTDKLSKFERGSHVFNGITDDTPYGALINDQKSDNPLWIRETSLDHEAARGNPDEVCYVAIRSKKDFVDKPLNDTSRLLGAHLNREFDLRLPVELTDFLNLVEHSRVITEERVFREYRRYLDSNCGDGGK